MSDLKKSLKKLWYFIWEDNSVWSWLVNVVLAFVLIKFVVYPGLGFLLSTTHPVVAVVSESMEHNSNFDAWWKKYGGWYEDSGINKEAFEKFPSRNGFNKGDIMVLKGKKVQDIKIGDVIVFWSSKRDPIIHRVVKKWQANGVYYFQTKGDNNPTSLRTTSVDETNISQSQIVGNAILRIPLLGWIKIIAVRILEILVSLF